MVPDMESLSELEGDQQTLYPIAYNKSHYTVIANRIIKGKQEMSLQESKIVRLLITQVVKEDSDLKTYRCNIKELASFLGVSKSNLYRDIRSICDSLMMRVIRLGTGDPKQKWKLIHWVSSAEYDGKYIILSLSEEIKPYVLELEEWFTQYQLVNILEMSSFYAVRLYELLKSDEFRLLTGQQKALEYDIAYLRYYFDCEDKYLRFSQFHEKVLKTAVRDINNKTDIIVTKMEFTKTGKKITSVAFELIRNSRIAIEREMEERMRQDTEEAEALQESVELAKKIDRTYREAE